MTFNICNVIFTLWIFLALGMYLAKHGEPREGTYNFWTALFSTVLQMVLLYFGGFYG